MLMTRFPINRTRRATAKLLGSPYAMHAAIAGSFPTPSSNPEPGTRPLWRVDTNPSGDTWLYIVSATAPSLVGLDEQIGWPDLQPQWITRDYGPFLNRLAAGQEWAFRLVANPVHAVSAHATSDRRSRRSAHVTAVQQASWLIGRDAYADQAAIEVSPDAPPTEESRSARHGFQVSRDQAGIPQLIVSNRRRWEFKRMAADRHPITLNTAQFDGVLEVTDAASLRHALVRGIGHGKAFGCGLLTLAPPTATPGGQM